MRIRHGLAAGTFAASLLCAAPLLAADRSDGGGNRGNRDGFYIGAGIGDFNADLDSVDQVNDVDLDFSNEDAARVFAGWRFNRFFAVELDYTDFGTSSNPSAAPGLLGISTDSTGWTPSLVATLPIGPVELFAKAGMVFYDVDVNTNANNVTDAVNDSGNDPVYGVGVGFTVAKRLNLRAQYERYDISTFNDANAVWLSASWRF